MEGRGIKSLFQITQKVLLLIMMGRAHCGKMKLGNSEDIKIEWKML